MKAQYITETGEPVRIVLLADHPEYLPVVAGWLFAEWAHYSPIAI
jgi:hypothetical protein